MQLIRRADLEGRPWKNGGGTTWELASAPEGAGFEDFLWRFSIAEVAQEGPFSAFPGIDRSLTLLAGPELRLEFAGGGTVRLTPGAGPLAFPGEAAVYGKVPAGPIFDFNVMSRRGRIAHRVLPAPAGSLPPPDCAALLCRAEQADYMGYRLSAGDLLLFAQGERGAPIPAGAGFLAIQITDLCTFPA